MSHGRTPCFASPDAANVSGQVIIVYGQAMTVVNAPNVEQRFQTDGSWTVASVGEALTPYFAAREPVTDGFLVPPF